MQLSAVVPVSKFCRTSKPSAASTRGVARGATAVPRAMSHARHNSPRMTPPAVAYSQLTGGASANANTLKSKSAAARVISFGWGGFWHRRRRARPCGRGSHSSTSQLNVSALYGIGGTRMGYVARV
jgi:hypothetical protein